MNLEHEAIETHLPPVYAVTYDHFGVVLWGEAFFEQVVDKELDWLERYPEFCMGWDHEAWTYDYLAEYSPQLLHKLKDGLARFRGRLGVGSCTYGQPLSMFIDGESNIRQLTMALDTSEKVLGYLQSVYIISEHAFHSQLPQLLVGCGFQGAIMRTHFMMYGHNPEYDEPVGWWIGVDGSRIPTLPTYRGQASTPPKFTHKIPGNTSTLDNRILTDAPSPAYPISLADFRRAFGERIQPLIATRADDARNLEEMITVHAGDPDYRWILLEEIFDLLPYPRAEFRSQPNDFKVRMPWGYCGNWIWQRARAAEVKVQIAERLVAINHALGGESFEAEIERAWKNLLVGQHHDIHICGLLEDAQTYLGNALDESEAVIDSVMQTVGARIGDGERHVVFNPLPWARTELVATESSYSVVSMPALAFTAIASVKDEQTTPVFEWQADHGVLRTPFYEVFLAETGGFRLVRDRATGNNLLVPPKTSGALAGVVDGRLCESMGTVVEVTVDSYQARMVEEGKIGGIPYRCEWTFYKHTRRIDWHGELIIDGQLIGQPKHSGDIPVIPPDWNERTLDAWKIPAFNDHEQKIRIRFFPYLSPYATGIRDYPFGVAETTDRYVQGVYWTAVSDGNVGLAIFNRGCMGSVREPDGAFSSVLAFSMPYVWNTRLLQGRYTYELGLWPFRGDWQQADLHRHALEYNFPANVTSVSSQGDSLGERWSPYAEQGKGAILSALYVKNDNTYARFYESAGGRAEVAFDWMDKAAHMTEVNMRQQRLGSVGGRKLLGPWQILTIEIDTPDER
ncbi:MAG: hypothetical protein KF893_02175 [Caldilineaceae bacterium]|nr:hypothetical protein [Caldilineaceae bacterium]